MRVHAYATMSFNIVMSRHISLCAYSSGHNAM